MEVLLISGIFMSFFIALLLITKKGLVITDKILAFWMIIIGIHLLGFYFNQIGYWQKYPHLIGTTAPFPLLHGPMLYLYTLYSLRGDQKIRRIDYLHFAPVLIAYVYMFKFFFFFSVQEKLRVDQGEIKSLENFKYVLLIAILISGITYAFLAYRLTWIHKNKVENNFSYKEGINLKWLRNCILAIALVFLSATIIYLFREVIGYSFNFNADYIFYLIIILLVFYIGYFGIKQENIFTNSPQINHKVSNTKYKNSGLKIQEAEKLHFELLKIMRDKKPFLDPKLTLSELAKLLDTSSNWLSQVINQYEQNNFHDFINEYRVEKFIQKASENKQYSILALALDSGFNSKSSFNTIFKKFKGLTPSAFLSANSKEEAKNN